MTPLESSGCKDPRMKFLPGSIEPPRIWIREIDFLILSSRLLASSPPHLPSPTHSMIRELVAKRRSRARNNTVMRIIFPKHPCGKINGTWNGPSRKFERIDESRTNGFLPISRNIISRTKIVQHLALNSRNYPQHGYVVPIDRFDCFLTVLRGRNKSKLTI